RLRHVRYVLPGGDEYGRDAVGRVQPVVVGPGQKSPHVRHACVVVQRLGIDAHVLDEHVARDDALGGDALAARAHDVDLAGFLVGGEIAFEVEARNGT